MSTTAPTTITIRPPSKYASADTPSTFVPPPVEWLHRTWSVTHSTLKMWRSAQNVRITYKPLPESGSSPRIDDLVEYESNQPGKKGVKTVAGVDTASPINPATGTSKDSVETGAWDWKGKGLLFFVHSHWEVLGWGERPLADGSGVERWVVTWFAKTVFSQEGVDFYSDRREGLSEETAREIQAALESGPDGLATMVKEGMKAVDIKLPWQEK